MNLSQRLRTCAKHTGLDAVIELLQEAADEIDALQARAQVQGEPFGYIHHFAAHDESGALIDTTWEADGCADPLPPPTFPAMWKWAHCTPFYTTPQPAQATQAEAQQPATVEPVYWEWRHLSTHPDTVDFGKWSEWKRVEARSAIHTIDDALAEFRAYIAQGYKYELRALYDHPAPSVPADVVRVPLQVLKDASEALGNFVSDHGWGDTDMQAMDNLDAYIARHEAIDAAMLAAK